MQDEKIMSSATREEVDVIMQDSKLITTNPYLILTVPKHVSEAVEQREERLQREEHTKRLLKYSDERFMHTTHKLIESLPHGKEFLKKISDDPTKKTT